MGLTITQVILEKDTEKPDTKARFSVMVKAAAKSPAKLVLSKATSVQEPYFVAEASGIWSGDELSAVFELAVFQELPTAYVVLKDDAGVLSNFVRIFVKPPEVRSYRIKEDVLFLYFNRSSTDSLMAEKLQMFLKKETVTSDLPECRIDLKAFVLHEEGEDTSRLHTQVVYHTKSNSAYVCSLPAKIELLLKKPVLTEVGYDGSRLTLTVSEPGMKRLHACLYCNGDQIAESDLIPDKDAVFQWDISKWKLDPACRYTVMCTNKNEIGESPCSVPKEVITELPSVAACSLKTDGLRLTMEKAAVYSYSYGQKNGSFVGKELKLAELLDQSSPIKICHNLHGSKGPELSYKVVKPAYYTFRQGERLYYLFGERPSSAPTADLEQKLPDGCSDYLDGSYFKAEAKTSKLTLKKEIFTASDLDEVHTDFKKMICASCDTPSKTAALLDLIKDALPMCCEDLLFYHYGFTPLDAYIDVVEGMSIFVEYASYQNVPEENRLKQRKLKPEDAASYNYELNGYTGSQTARYQVISREGRLTFEPFIRAMVDAKNAFQVPAASITSDNHLSGGSGVCDLLFDGFAAPYIRIVYPCVYPDRDSTGELDYDKNICILSANSFAYLEDATVRLRTHKPPHTEVAYTYFRGRSNIIPRIRVFAFGASVWVSVGTKVGDLAVEFGVPKELPVFLERESSAGYCSVLGTDVREMPLMIGDRIKA